jgi:hypothetical protein
LRVYHDFTPSRSRSRRSGGTCSHRDPVIGTTRRPRSPALLHLLPTLPTIVPPPLRSRVGPRPLPRAGPSGTRDLTGRPAHPDAPVVPPTRPPRGPPTRPAPSAPPAPAGRPIDVSRSAGRPIDVSRSAGRLIGASGPPSQPIGARGPAPVASAARRPAPAGPIASASAAGGRSRRAHRLPGPRARGHRPAITPLTTRVRSRRSVPARLPGPMAGPLKAGATASLMPRPLACLTDVLIS